MSLKTQIKEALAEVEAQKVQEANDPPLRSLEDLRDLDAETINRRWPEVSTLLKAGGLAPEPVEGESESE